MRNVNVSFQIFISKDVNKPLVAVHPDFTFDIAGDKDNDVDFHNMCDMEYNVQQLVKYYRALGCKCEARRVETSFLGLDI